MTLFSKIIAGEIPSYKIAENDRFFAFLDVFPLREGHVLVETVGQLLRLRPYRAEDLNDDGAVDAQDLAALLSEWGNFGGVADLNGDGVVDAADLAAMR